MKNLNMIIWLTQLGFSIVFPLAGFTLLGAWLRQRFDLGVWVFLLCLFVGLVCAVDGFRVSLNAMESMSKDKRPDDNPPPVSFNDHS